MEKKAPSSIDKHIGVRVRLRRNAAGISQEKLADALGLTFQQVQKYEKGTNRIGAGRLLSIATILGVSVEYFFEGLPDLPSNGAARNMIQEFQSLPDSDRLVRGFLKLKDEEARRKVTDLVEWMASAGQPEARRDRPT